MTYVVDSIRKIALTSSQSSRGVFPFSGLRVEYAAEACLCWLCIALRLSCRRTAINYDTL